MKHLYLFILVFLLPTVQTIAQTEIAKIPLDNRLRDITEIIHFTDAKGKNLLKFQNKDHAQYSLIIEDSLQANKTIPLKERYELLECLSSNRDFTLFYKNERNNAIHTFNMGQRTISDKLSAINIPKSKERYITHFYHKGDFLVFKYSKSPFTLHTYTIGQTQSFVKQSQDFQHRKRETFVGQIKTNEEFILVRMSTNPFQLHFYRYVKHKGFEKRSVDIRSLYKVAGIDRRVSTADILFNESTPLLASIIDNTIYLYLDNVLYVNPSFSRKKNRMPLPNVLQLNWKNKQTKLLTFGGDTDYKFDNRSSMLLDNLYFKLLVSRQYFDLSIYDMTSDTLLKEYAYTANEDIELIHGEATVNKASYLSFDAGVAAIPLTLRKRNSTITDTKKILRSLSADNLFLDVYNDDNIIELEITGTRQQTILFDEVITTSFTGYLSKSDLEIVKNPEEITAPKWKEVEAYMDQLTQSNKDLEHIIVYESQGSIYVAYADEIKRYCRVVRF